MKFGIINLIAIFIYESLIELPFSEATPIRGIRTCLNNEDCLGAFRHCIRNKTMKIGQCVCDEGFRSAKGDEIKCELIENQFCKSQKDCPSNLICKPQLGLHLGFRADPLDQFPFSNFDTDIRKKCSIKTDDKKGRIKYYKYGFDGDYVELDARTVKVMEDAILVVFFICVIVTLMFVHKGGCYKQFRDSRRNGSLRYIIPHRDEQPPPYDNYRAEVLDQQNVTQCEVSDSMDFTDFVGVVSHPLSGMSDANKRHSRETPPPTYDEALVISSSQNTTTTNNNNTNQLSTAPLYISLPREELEADRETIEEETNNSSSSEPAKHPTDINENAK